MNPILLMKVEIPSGGRIKYEDHHGNLWVNRFLCSNLTPPGNYGFIANTIAEDSQPLDVMAFAPCPVQAGTWMKIRVLGAIDLMDGDTSDVKIIAVPDSSLTSLFDSWKTIDDLPFEFKKNVEFFFLHQKEVTCPGNVKIKGWISKENALQWIEKSSCNPPKIKILKNKNI